MKNFIIISNIFLFLPVIASAYIGEWLYFFFAIGLSIFSPIYHILRESNTSKKKLLNLFKRLDWLFAIGAYIYMYYFIFTKIDFSLKILFLVLLTLTLIFFWYGYKSKNYKRLHPWFHLIAPIISSLIVISKI